MTLHKTAAADTHVRPEGTVEALVATWDLDRVRDRIRPGAFAKSLDAWRRSRKRIPLVWSHETKNPSMVIGSADPHASRETDRGLLLSGRLNIDSSAAADHVYDLLASGTVSDWSFGYQIERQQKMAGGITELIQLDLLEAGPCVAGANRMTETLSVKGLEPDRRDPRVPSHVELEGRLREAGILTRIAPPDLAQREHDALAAVLDTRRNGGDENRKRMTALLTPKDFVSTKTAGPIRIASFEC
jgi:HK97 family phage prohead protease